MRGNPRNLLVLLYLKRKYGEFYMPKNLMVLLSIPLVHKKGDPESDIH